jgi:hypothetical protein
MKECFARDRDHMLLANFESVRGFETKGKPWIVQRKTVCRISHHFWPTGISALTVPTRSPLASFERDVNVAVCLDF